ncbi:hypothetical protein [Shewanella aestuarii]|uniref:FAD/FMN-containing dehydrogenase n=1 Tax=Shewanella aestuarii TaxID=1028752 RepID=A0A6G9QH38_9GAMM|nr:hypothetical protein [Shewanella aestuarii]QIR13483.1 hypothetical protein HBH39_02350 [Shewanella aestuarii]
MRHFILLLSLIFTSVSAQAAAEQQWLKVGDKLAPISLQDQFDKPIEVTAKTTMLIFSRDMDGGEVVQAAFAEAPKEQWPQNMVYIADISGMPSLIAKFIAVPKMKDYPFVLGLDREGAATANLPTTEKQATIIKLNQLEVISIEQVADANLLIKKW